MFDVKFYEVFREEKELLKFFLPANISAAFESTTIQESGNKNPPAKLICTRTQSKLPQHWFSNIDGVLTRSQGYDHLMGVPNIVKCGYLGCYCALAVAEHAVITMQMLVRKMKLQMRHFHSFHREEMTGKQIKGLRALVVGVGNIGSEIVHEAKKLGMEVKGVDSIKRMKNLKYISLNKGLSWANVIFCALPLTEQTRGLLNYGTLKKSGKEKYLINISRGEITPTVDLRKMLDQNILAGVSLDVYEQESHMAEILRRGMEIGKNSPIREILNLKDRDNVIFTPHNAFNTHEALNEKCRLTVEEVMRFLNKKQFRWKV
jgi:D-lactate dehydrogenase